MMILALFAAVASQNHENNVPHAQSSSDINLEANRNDVTSPVVASQNPSPSVPQTSLAHLLSGIEGGIGSGFSGFSVSDADNLPTPPETPFAGRSPVALAHR
jgi:hypothetical protein